MHIDRKPLENEGRRRADEAWSSETDIPALIDTLGKRVDALDPLTTQSLNDLVEFNRWMTNHGIKEVVAGTAEFERLISILDMWRNSYKEQTILMAEMKALLLKHEKFLTKQRDLLLPLDKESDN